MPCCCFKSIDACFWHWQTVRLFECYFELRQNYFESETRIMKVKNYRLSTVNPLTFVSIYGFCSNISILSLDTWNSILEPNGWTAHIRPSNDRSLNIRHVLFGHRDLLPESETRESEWQGARPQVVCAVVAAAVAARRSAAAAGDAALPRVITRVTRGGR